MSTAHLPPTRLNLLRTRRRLDRMAKGTDLLRRKREALVAELFHLARPAADARVRIATEAQAAYPLLLQAMSHHGAGGLGVLAWPPRELHVEIQPGSVWGIAVARITERSAVPRTLAARGLGPVGTGPATVSTALAFERLTELLLEAAPKELLLRRIGEALARTSRQVHMLERRVQPQLRADIDRVRRVLDEREREERLRLSNLMRRRPSPSRLPST